MRIIGIVAEYNPFHKGHKYQIDTAKKELGADYVIVCMSGNFVQRGEASIADKWERTKMALLGGADLVLELPVIYSVSSAELFSSAAVSILNASNIVTDLVFGTESDDLAPLISIANELNLESEKFKEMLKLELSKGSSFAKAREAALIALGIANSNILSSPNNILAIEYLKAINALNSSINPFALKREYVEHDSKIINGDFASASYIRNRLHLSRAYDIKTFLPNESYDIIVDSVKKGKMPINTDFYSDLLLYKLRTLSKEALREFPYVSEGLENRIISVSSKYSVFNEISKGIKSKRYALTRINRILVNILLDIKKSDLNKFDPYKPEYLRVLGFKKSDPNLLKLLTQKSSAKVIVNVKKELPFIGDNARKLLEIEKMSTDIYYIKSPNKIYKKSGREFTNPVVTI